MCGAAAGGGEVRALGAVVRYIIALAKATTLKHVPQAVRSDHKVGGQAHCARGRRGAVSAFETEPRFGAKFWRGFWNIHNKTNNNFWQKRFGNDTVFGTNFRAQN